jgi:integrase/recombinase XerD
MIHAHKIVHRNQDRIRVDLPNNQEFNAQIRKIDDARWSQTLRAWHVPYTKEAFDLLKNLFPEIGIEKGDESARPAEPDIKQRRAPATTY